MDFSPKYQISKNNSKRLSWKKKICKQQYQKNDNTGQEFGLYLNFNRVSRYVFEVNYDLRAFLLAITATEIKYSFRKRA